MNEEREKAILEAVDVVADAIVVSRIFHKYSGEISKIDTVLDHGYNGLRELAPTETHQIAVFKERITQLTALKGLMLGANHTLRAMDKIMLKYKMDKIMEPADHNIRFKTGSETYEEKPN